MCNIQKIHSYFYSTLLMILQSQPNLRVFQHENALNRSDHSKCLNISIISPQNITNDSIE